MKVSAFINETLSKDSIALSQVRKYQEWNGVSDINDKRGYIVFPSAEVTTGKLIHRRGYEDDLEHKGANFEKYTAQAQSFCWIKDGYLCVRSQTIFDNQGRSIKETLSYRGSRAEPIEITKDPDKMGPWAKRVLEKEIERIDEPVARVSNDAAVVHSAHWCLQTLPAIDFIRRIGLLNEVKLALPPLKDWQIEMLEFFKIPLDRVLQLPENVYSCSTLLHVSPPDRYLEMFFHPEQFRMYDSFSTHLIDPAPSPKRIYLTRFDVDRRKLDQELELIETLKTLGFKSYTMGLLGFKDQLEVFRDATFMLGAHGSSFTGMLFSAYKPVICELFPIAPMPRNHAFHMRTIAVLRGYTYAGYFIPPYYRDPDTHHLRCSLNVPDCARYVKSLLAEYENVL